LPCSALDGKANGNHAEHVENDDPDIDGVELHERPSDLGQKGTRQ
jgi:hypothetical protein